MAELFDCPSCGASLQLDDDDDNLVTCQHCGKSVMVPETLRRKPQSSPQHSYQPGVQVINVQTPVTWDTSNAKAPRRFWSCLLTFLVVFIIGMTALAFVAPLAMTGLVAKIIGDSSGIFQEASTTQAAGQTGAMPGVSVPVIGDLVASPTPPENKYAHQALVFGNEGVSPGNFDDTRSVAVDGQGFIYTGEYSDHRIQKFSPDGAYVSGWMAEGENAVMSMAAGRNGVIYIVSTGNVYKYDSDGKLLGVLEKPNKDYLEAVAITPDNGLVVASSNSIYRFDSDEQLVFQVEKAAAPASDNGSIIGGIAVDGLGNIYVPIQFSQQGKFKTAIFIYDGDGQYVNRFGSEGDEPGQMRSPNALGVDAQGRLYVADFKGIQIFTAEGAYLDRIDVDGVPFGLWFDGSGQLYVASNADKIYKYNIVQ